MVIEGTLKSLFTLFLSLIVFLPYYLYTSSFWLSPLNQIILFSLTCSCLDDEEEEEQEEEEGAGTEEEQAVGGASDSGATPLPAQSAIKATASS